MGAIYRDIVTTYRSRKVPLPHLLYRPNHSLIKSTYIATCQINDRGRVPNLHACTTVSNNVSSGPQPVACRSICQTLITGQVSTPLDRAVALTNGRYRSKSVLVGSTPLPLLQASSIVAVTTANTCGCDVTSGCGHIPQPTTILIERKSTRLVLHQRALRSLVQRSYLPRALDLSIGSVRK